MEFVVALLKRLHDDQNVTLATAANEVYYATLYKYHGWITSSAFVLALKVCSYSVQCLRTLCLQLLSL